MKELLFIVVEWSILLIEIFAFFIIIYGAGLSIYSMFVKTKKTPGLIIGESLDIGLRYLMVGEVLHSIISDSITDLVGLAILLAIRVAIVFVNQKEIDHEIQLIEEHKQEAEETEAVETAVVVKEDIVEEVVVEDEIVEDEVIEDDIVEDVVVNEDIVKDVVSKD